MSTEITGPWRFRLLRKQDETGISGTGHVADGVQFQDGTCALHWRGPLWSTAFYTNHETLMKIHGHGGATVCQWLDQAPTEVFNRGATDCLQDRCENCPLASVGGPGTKPDLFKAPHYIAPVDVDEYLRGYRACAEDLYGPNWAEG